MFGVSSRLDMQIRIVARRALRLHRIIQVVRSQLLNLVIHRLADEIALLHPSRGAGGSAHLDEMTVSLQHFHAIAILDDSSFLVDCGDMIAQDGLHSRDVSDLEHPTATAIAGRRENHQRETNRGRRRAKQRCREERHRIEVLL